MSVYLGVDTSNYTTSVAVYNSVEGVVLQQRRPLPVKSGERGIRQSDAVFHHTVALPALMSDLFREAVLPIPSAIGASVKPRDVVGSYMPCFLAGVNAAQSAAVISGVPFYEFSHQAGHIAAAVYSARQTALFHGEFLAFHVSGGTTELLLVRPDNERGFSVRVIGCSLDLHAGQVVDRVGLMLGLDFPCGAALDALAGTSKADFHIKTTLDEGNCHLSGLENRCEQRLRQGEAPADVARLCIESIVSALEAMTIHALDLYGDLPIVFCGGVTANSIMRERFTKTFKAVFADPAYATDNATGIAVLTALRHERSE